MEISLNDLNNLNGNLRKLSEKFRCSSISNNDNYELLIVELKSDQVHLVELLFSLMAFFNSSVAVSVLQE